MTISWRDLSYDEDADAHVEAHFCGRGSSDKDPTKPSRSILLQLLLKEKVASGKLIIDRINDGIPIIIRGRVHVPEDIVHPEDTSTPTQSATSDLMQSQSQTQSLSQLQPHAQATPTQLAMENARLARVALAKATRIAQERTQEEEANRIKQDATADLRKAKKEDRYRATMEKLGKLPPCPKLCRGEECSGTPCDEEGQGFSYEHMGDLVVCQDKAHLSMATTDGCLLSGVSCSMHGHRGRGRQSLRQKPNIPQKTWAGEPRARGNPPRTTATRERRGSHVRQERGLSSSSSSSSSSATRITGGL
jgi:hypothetical protein